MTLGSVPWSKFEHGTSQLQVGSVAASVNFRYLIVISANNQKIQRCTNVKNGGGDALLYTTAYAYPFHRHTTYL